MSIIAWWFIDYLYLYKGYYSNVSLSDTTEILLKQ